MRRPGQGEHWYPSAMIWVIGIWLIKDGPTPPPPHCMITYAQKKNRRKQNMWSHVQSGFRFIGAVLFQRSHAIPYYNQILTTFLESKIASNAVHSENDLKINSLNSLWAEGRGLFFF